MYVNDGLKYARLSPQVSWIRKADLHILTMVDVVYTGDDRYSISHPNGSSDWVLAVRDAQVNDSGVYECQINTEPKRSKAYQLKVVGEFADVQYKYDSSIIPFRISQDYMETLSRQNKRTF